MKKPFGVTPGRPFPATSARLVSFDQKRTELTPGTILVREWDRQSQRVMVMSDGFAWNGQTYDSLSKVAFAITGTKWNGPRFFGLRDKEDRLAAVRFRCAQDSSPPTPSSSTPNTPTCSPMPRWAGQRSRRSNLPSGGPSPPLAALASAPASQFDR
jgi:hypothetical protein